MTALDLAAAFIDEDTDATLTHTLFIGQGDVGLADAPRHFAHVGIALHHGLVQELFLVLEHLLLDDILIEDLVVELEWLLVYKLVIEAFTVGGLDDVTLRVDTVLVADLSWSLVLTLELLFLLDSVIMVVDQAARR